MGIQTFPLSGKGLPQWLSYLDALNDGSDGNSTVSSNTTLTSGIYRYDTLTVNSGITLTASGTYLILLAKTKITINGLISQSGKGVAGGSSGAVGNNGSLMGGSGGGGGGGSVSSTAYSGFVGGSCDGIVGGYGGSNTPAPGNNYETVYRGGRMPSDFRSLLTIYGAGGGGAGFGGDGGAGGGLLILMAPIIDGTGAARADGANGVTVVGVSGEGHGGGGGGGGGVVVCITKSGQLLIPTVTANGGSGGLGYSNTALDSNRNGGTGGNGVVTKLGVL